MEDFFLFGHNGTTHMHPFTVKEEKTVVFNACTETTDFDTVLSVWDRVDGVRKNANFMNDDGENEACERKSLLRAPLQSGDYFLAVEAYDEGVWGGFYNLTITCEEPRSSERVVYKEDESSWTTEDCPNVKFVNDTLDIISLENFCEIDGDLTIDGTTVNKQRLYELTGPSTLFPFYLNETSKVHFDTMSSVGELDTLLQIYQSCDENTPVFSSNDDYDFFEDEYRSYMDVNLVPGQWYLAVTGWGEGDFVLTARCQADKVEDDAPDHPAQCSLDSSKKSDFSSFSETFTQKELCLSKDKYVPIAYGVTVDAPHVSCLKALYPHSSPANVFHITIDEPKIISLTTCTKLMDHDERIDPSEKVTMEDLDNVELEIDGEGEAKVQNQAHKVGKESKNILPTDFDTSIQIYRMCGGMTEETCDVLVANNDDAPFLGTPPTGTEEDVDDDETDKSICDSESLLTWSLPKGEYTVVVRGYSKENIGHYVLGAKCQ
eukprot:GHVL01024476.1.p1 GENE.GHVL01024476.1~~GHVL01024476.1.p1  ORF type:complete len:490 (+),score=111.24 GHVL01024476.1:248-1717(+)